MMYNIYQQWDNGKSSWDCIADSYTGICGTAIGELEKIFNASDRVYIMTGTLSDDKHSCFIIYNFEDLRKIWSNNYVKLLLIYENGYGKLNITVNHLHGTNYWEVKELTSKGKTYLKRNGAKDAKELYGKLKKYPYSRNIRLVRKIWDNFGKGACYGKDVSI